MIVHRREIFFGFSWFFMMLFIDLRSTKHYAMLFFISTTSLRQLYKFMGKHWEIMQPHAVVPRVLPAHTNP